MSCLGPNYNPIPSRQWSRVQNPLPNNDNIDDLNAHYAMNQMKIKGNVLQYYKNANEDTTALSYLKNNMKSLSTQGQQYTNPNIRNYERIDYINVDSVTGEITDQTNYCPTYTMPTNNTLPNSIPVPVEPPKSLPPPPAEKKPSTFAVVTPNKPANHISIITNGNMLCNRIVHKCTQLPVNNGLIPVNNRNVCNPTTSSNVPGKIMPLCFNRDKDWIMRSPHNMSRLTMNNSGNKWSIGEKNIYIA